MTEIPPESKEFGSAFHGAVTNVVRRAEEAMSVVEVIGKHAEVINKSRYRLFFSQTQLAEVDLIVLSLAKLFDPPSRRYPTRSILAVLTHLETHAETLPLLDRKRITEWLVSAGVAAEGLSSMADSEISPLFVSQYRLQFQDADTSLGGALNRLRFRRNKEIAHNEAVESEARLQATWDDVRLVLQAAKRFAGLIGPSFFGFHFEANDGTYMLDRYHQDPGKQLTRLLEDLGLVTTGTNTGV